MLCILQIALKCITAAIKRMLTYVAEFNHQLSCVQARDGDKC